MGRPTDRSRRRSSSHSSKSRRSRSRDAASPPPSSSSGGETPSRSPSPEMTPWRNRRFLPRPSRGSPSSRGKRSRASEPESDGSESEEEEDRAASKRVARGRRSDVGREEKYRKLNGKWFSKEEYAILEKAGMAKGRMVGGDVSSPDLGVLGKGDEVVKVIPVEIDLEMSEDEEDRIEMEEEAEELIQNLRAPLKSFETQAVSSLKSAIEGAGARFDEDIKTLDGQAIRDHLATWKQAVEEKRTAALEGWTTAALKSNTLRKQAVNKVASLKGIHEEQAKGFEEVKKQWNEALERQEQELGDIESDVQKMKKKYATKMESATDWNKIRHEISRKQAEVLGGY